MYQNQNKNYFHLNPHHGLLWVIAITNLLLIGTIWYAPTINASYASAPVKEAPAPVAPPVAPTPIPQPQLQYPVVNPYSPQYYPTQNQPGYYPGQTPTFYGPTTYSQPPVYDPYQSGYTYQPPVKFLVGL